MKPFRDLNIKIQIRIFATLQAVLDFLIHITDFNFRGRFYVSQIKEH